MNFAKEICAAATAEAHGARWFVWSQVGLRILRLTTDPRNPTPMNGVIVGATSVSALRAQNLVGE